MPPCADLVIQDTVRWLERAVIGLNLCPFAKATHVRGQIHYAVCNEEGAEAVVQAIETQALALTALASEARDTTLVILPCAGAEFLEFVDLVRRCERRLRKLGLDGELQLAHFHPQYQFADEQPHDIAHATNRSPYPTLQLLREASLSRALAGFAHPERIYEANIVTLQRLGLHGWQALDVGARA